MLHKAWNSKGEVPYRFPRSSIKFQGHMGQNITHFDPNWAFPDYRPVAAFKSLRFALFYNILCNHVQGSVSLWCFLEMIYTECTLTFMYVSSWHFLCIVVILIEATWHIYASVNWVIIGSGNDLLPVQCQAITWTNVGPMLDQISVKFEIKYCTTIFTEENEFESVVCKMGAILLGLHVLNEYVGAVILSLSPPTSNHL